MSRNRVLPSDFFFDEELAKVSAHARLLYQGLGAICDDHFATVPNRPEWIRMQVFPYEPLLDTSKLLRELMEVKRIILFLDSGKEYWYLHDFLRTQTINRPSKPKYPKFEPNKAVGSGLFEGLRQPEYKHSVSTPTPLTLNEGRNERKKREIYENGDKSGESRISDREQIKHIGIEIKKLIKERQ